MSHSTIKTQIMTKQTNEKHLLRKLFKISKPYYGLILIGLLATICLSGVDALFAYLIAPIINKGFVHKNYIFIAYLPIIVLILFLFRGLFEFVSTYQLSKATKLLLASMRQKVFHKILHLPIQYFKEQKSGSILSLLIYNVDQLSNATTTTVLIAVRELALLMGLVFVIFYLNWRLALLLFLIIPIVFILFRYSSRKMRKIGKLSQMWMGNVTQIAQEAIYNIEILKLFTADKYEQKRFDHSINQARRQDLKAVKTNSISSGVIQIMFALVLALVLWMSMLPQMHLSAGAFAAIIGALIQLLRPIRRLTSINSSLQIGLSGAQSVFDFLDLSNEKNTGTIEFKDQPAHIQFDKVCYQYPNSNESALTDITFEAKPNTVNALVGFSGSGKTTLINTLSRFILPQSGSITLNNYLLSDYKLKNLREHMALVTQTPQLFNDSILNNIAYGKEVGETEKIKVIEAAKAANIWKFIQTLPKGLDTTIGDQGVMLSGGQKQRLAIARAIYKDAPILILDEATSALDSHNEKIIQTALNRLMVGRTTFVIAHRLSTILHADQILVFNKGCIIEKGNHAELIAYKGHYAKLYELQFLDHHKKDKA